MDSYQFSRQLTSLENSVNTAIHNEVSRLVELDSKRYLNRAIRCMGHELTASGWSDDFVVEFDGRSLLSVPVCLRIQILNDLEKK